MVLVQSAPATEYVPGARLSGERRPDETVTEELTEGDTVRLKSHDPVWLLLSCHVPDTE